MNVGKANKSCATLYCVGPAATDGSVCAGVRQQKALIRLYCTGQSYCRQSFRNNTLYSLKLNVNISQFDVATLSYI